MGKVAQTNFYGNSDRWMDRHRLNYIHVAPTKILQERKMWNEHIDKVKRYEQKWNEV